MVTCFKIWLQAIATTFLVFASITKNVAQPLHLLPEADVTSGLPSNIVHVTEQDHHKRLWIGTEQGLVILNDKTGQFKSIIETIGPNAVWAIAFYKDQVFIGTRYHGLFIFNLATASLFQTFSNNEIGLCRRLRVIHDTIFLATRSLPYKFVIENGKWKSIRIKSNLTQEFITDFALFKGKVYASIYGTSQHNIYELHEDSLFISKTISKTLEGHIPPNTLSLLSNDSSLFIGGDGFIQSEIIGGNVNFKSIRGSNNGKLYPIWDISNIDSLCFYGIGNPDNNQEGMILIQGVSNISNMRNNFYCQSLKSDTDRHGLWAGTYNRGLFYWSNPSNSIPIGANSFEDAEYVSVNTQIGLIHNNRKIALVDWKSRSIKTIIEIDKSLSNIHDIMAVSYIDNHLYFISRVTLHKCNLKGEVLYKSSYNLKSEGIAKTILKSNNRIQLFSLYHDYVFEFDGIKITNKKAISNEIKAAPYRGNILYFSVGTGFHYYDTIGHSLKTNHTTIESFCIKGDSLWALKGGMVYGYKIDLAKQALVPFVTENYQNKIKGFYPNWIAVAKGKLLLGNEKGILELSSINAQPKNYHYQGNYSTGKAPTSDGNSLIFNQNNFLSKFDPEQFNTPVSVSQFKPRIQPESDIYKNSPFKIDFLSNDYILLKSSLKEVIVTDENNKKIDTIYTILDEIDMPKGLKSGQYNLSIRINELKLPEMALFIEQSLTDSPFFYPGLGLALLVFVILLVRSLLLKKLYERKIMANRLQLLKQNLNPHFIFNSLNLIYSLVLQKKNEAAIKTISNFSDLHRYYLDNINKKDIPLTEELAFVESYLKMESERVELDDPFQYQILFSSEESLDNILVPPMILQPLVENAVKYSKSRPGIRSITIDLKKIGNRVCIGIENTTIESEHHKVHGNGLGIKLVKERIEIYNYTYRVKIEFRSRVKAHYYEAGYRQEIIF